MTSLSTLIKQGRKEEIWTKYCGFLDLTIDEFMEIQERLLMEQIDLLGKSMMGRMLMGDVIPGSIDEFREVVPLTTYQDYVGYLDTQREDVLPRKPKVWCHTSGRTGEYKFKWVPYTQKMYDRLAEVVVQILLGIGVARAGHSDFEASFAEQAGDLGANALELLEGIGFSRGFRFWFRFNCGRWV